MTHVYNNCNVKGDKLNIVGNHNTITGNKNRITGNHNTVHGNYTSLVGNYNKLYGNHNEVVDGNYNVVKGDDNKSTGVGNQMDGKNNTAKAKAQTTVNFSTHGFAGNNVGGVQTMINHGNYTHTNHGSQVNSFTTGGGGVATISVGRGVGMQTTNGSTIVNDFSGRGGFTTVVIDNDDDDSLDSSTSEKAAKPVRKRASDADNNNNRQRDRSPPPSKKITYPEPWPEEPAGPVTSHKCRHCKTRTAVVIAWPCTHTYLCVKCTLDIKPIACIGCKKDVTAFKKVESEDD